MAYSFEARFTVTNLPEPLTVLTSHISFRQPMDRRGRPMAGVRSGTINLRLLGDDRAVLTEWAMNPMRSLTGSVTFLDPVTKTTLRILCFEDTYCIRYHEVFVVSDSVTAYTFDVGLTARQIFIDDSFHDNMWSDWIPGEGR